jgi:hypothetical protein
MMNEQRATARIDSLQRYEYLNGVRHQFIMIHAVHDQGGEFWIRLDRYRNTAESVMRRNLAVSSSFDVPAQDMVCRDLPVTVFAVY